MGNIILCLASIAFFFYMYMRANSALKKASPTEFSELWSFLRLLVLFFLVYFSGAFLWMVAGYLA